MNIEEKYIPSAIRRADGQIVEFHMSIGVEL
jgi:hypothetical protein